MEFMSKAFRVVAVLAGIIMLSTGCVSRSFSPETIRTLDKLSTQGTPLKITQIPIPGPTLPFRVQTADGAVWAVSGSFSKTKTIRVNTTSYQVDTLDRPFDSFDLYLGEHSLWLSDAALPVFGGGNLHRYDIRSNQLVATVAGAGSPLGIEDGMLWTYNQRTKIVSAVDPQTNLVKKKITTEGQGIPRNFAIGSGSIWQFASRDELSVWQQAKGAAVPSVVRRIDPQSNKVIAEIEVGDFRHTAGIYFVAGAIWVLGDRQDRGGGIATRIDVKTNQILVSIALKSPPYLSVAANAFPGTPVFWDGGVWISTFYTAKGRMPGLLMKVDLRTNEVVDQLGLSEFDFPGISQPLLTVGAGALWAVARDAVLKIEKVQ